jgi:hypothetical protein
MPRVRIVCRVPGGGVQLAGRTYHDGDIVEVSPAWAAMLVAEGRGARVEDSPDTVQGTEPDVEHRDPMPGKKRKR